MHDVKGESLFRIALIRKETEAYDLALQTVTLVTKEPYSNALRANALVVQGLLLEQKADIPAAEMAYRTALQLVAEHGIALQRLGRVYMRYRETIEEAVTCFNQCVKIAPSDYVPWYLLGRCYMATTQVTIRCRIPRLCNTDIPFPHCLVYSSTLSQERHPHSRIHQLSFFIDFYCDIPHFSIPPPLLHSYLQFNDAFDAYNRALNLNPACPLVWCSLGIVFHAFGQYHESLQMFKRAVDLDTTVADAWYNVGSLYDMCGQKEDARMAYAKAYEYGLSHLFVVEPATTTLTPLLNQPTLVQNEPTTVRP